MKQWFKAIKSKTAQQIASSLAAQAIDSSLKMTKDLIWGGDLKQSWENQCQAFKNVGADIIDNLQQGTRKRRRDGARNAPKKLKKHTTFQSMKHYEWSDFRRLVEW